MRFYYAKNARDVSSYIDDWGTHRYLRLTPYSESYRMNNDLIRDGISSYGGSVYMNTYVVPDLLVILLLGVGHI